MALTEQWSPCSSPGCLLFLSAGATLKGAVPTMYPSYVNKLPAALDAYVGGHAFSSGPGSSHAGFLKAARGGENSGKADLVPVMVLPCPYHGTLGKLFPYLSLSFLFWKVGEMTS